MVQETSVNRPFVRLFMVVFALVAISVTIGIFFSKHEEADCPNINATRSLQLTAIKDQITGKEGTLLWEEVNPFRNNMHLSEGQTHIVVEEKGFYLVFAQATFKVPNQNRENLMLRVDVGYPEGIDQFSAVFATHCGNHSCGSGESDVVLNKPILLWLEPRTNLTVVTRPWQLVDYEKKPISTFLTIFKYSD